MAHYQVLFSGEVAHDAKEDVVRDNLARELGIDERKARQLFSGRTVVIKSQLTQEDAMTWQQRLSEFGAVCRVKDLTPVKGEKAQYYRAEKDRPDQDGQEHTLRDITAAHIECPRCGHLQLEASHCTHCGVDVAAAMKQKKKEDLIIEKKIRELRGQHDDPTQTVVFKQRVERFESGVDEAPASGGLEKVRSWFKKTS